MKDVFLLGGEGNTALQRYSNSLVPEKNLSGLIPAGAAVMNIQQDRQRRYWLCTSNGLVVLDERLRSSHTYLHDDHDPSSLPKNFLNNLLFKKDGEIWVMPWRQGIWKTDGNGRFRYVLTRGGDSLLAGSNVSKSLEDRNGNIWITDYTGGLYKYSPATGKTENIVSGTRLSNEYLEGDYLWTVSAGNIYRVNIHSDQAQIIPLPPGKNKYEYDFIPDDKGHLWIATKTGLLCFDTVTATFRAFTSADGLFTDVLDVCLSRLSDGNILMAGGNFATRFSPVLLRDSVEAAPLLFTGAQVDDQEKKWAGNHIDIGWNEKNIRLQWALLQYSNPLQNDYYYKMDGVNREWQYAGNRGEVSFHSLDPGTYVFRYKAATSQGQWSGEKTITLVIHPPFWKTGWFLLALIVVTGTLFYSVVRYISQRNLKERLLKLEKEQAIEKERNRISRDMHDELGSGLTKIAILTEVIKTQQSSSDPIEKISQTARGLVDSLDEMVWALNPHNDSLDKLAAYLAEYANEYMDGSGIACHISLPGEIRPWPVSEEKRRNIFMVVKEFLNNTVKHSGATNIFIALSQYNRGFELLMKDDGKGLDETAIPQSGNGLKNMRQRITQAGGTALLSSGHDGTQLKIIFEG